MILGIGIDLLSIPRLTSLLQRRGTEPFAKRILSSREQEIWKGLLHSEEESSKERERWLAVRWTSKEAIYKALHPHYTPTWKEISILKLPGSSKPHVVFEPIVGEVGERERWRDRWRDRWRFHLSVSHDGEYVVANVVVEEM